MAVRPDPEQLKRFRHAKLAGDIACYVWWAAVVGVTLAYLLGCAVETSPAATLQPELRGCPPGTIRGPLGRCFKP